ncbi:hypothetical protein [Amycolatopsis minnesotensis]|uniref:Uncharacterized protein n=1 Tax=Amycolatopsis minnesotensis TaxID=337894 RepID=A0ABN2RC76_9PSEU
MRDPNEACREQIRVHLSAQWRESVSLVHFRRRRFSYDVRGRRGNGHPVSSSVAHRVFGKAVLIVALAVVGVFLLLLLVIEAVLNLVGLELSLSGPLSKQGTLAVRGAPDSPAVQFADAVRVDDRTLWLAWSHSYLAVAVAGENRSSRILWQAPRGQRPKLKATEASLTWPDGSTVRLAITNRERQLVRDRGGRP